MPLSVMWICSGQTSVQHLVMLQAPTPASSRDHLAPFKSVVGVHIEVSQLDHLARAVEDVLAVMVAQDVAHVLAQETLDALAELLYAVHVYLLHDERPGGICSRCERRDPGRHPVVPRNVRHQVFDERESLYGVNSDRPPSPA